MLNSNAVLNLDYEKGYTVNNRSNETYSEISGRVNANSIEWDIYSKVDGFLHSHYNGLNSIFSYDDVIYMARIFLSNHAADTLNLFFGVTSSYGFPYLIKIGDVQVFRNFAIKIVGEDGNDEKKQMDFAREFSKTTSDNADKNEKEFLKILSKYNAVNSLSLYRGNNNCDKWSKLKLDGFNDIISTECN